MLLSDHLASKNGLLLSLALEMVQEIEQNHLLTWKAPEWFLIIQAELQGRGNVKPDKTCIR